uniref:Methyltransferase-like protein 22 n=1 Tax=Arcella intermedia TaxID=1963864 RepID=A0A6B2LAN9_9EUKA
MSDVHVTPEVRVYTKDMLRVSRFPLVLEEPDDEVKENHKDEEGDFVLKRPKKQRTEVLTIVHHMDTSIHYVGLQVWRGALLLGDFILNNQELFKNATIMELGCGSGFSGLIASRIAKKCYLTDFDEEVLKNCQRNVSLNSHLFEKDPNSDQLITQVKKLDLQQNHLNFPHSLLSLDSQFQWTNSDIENLKDLSIIIGADIIYSNSLTDSIFNFIQSLLKRTNSGTDPFFRKRCRFFIALEVRYIFSIEELDEVSLAYSYFKGMIEKGSFGLWAKRVDTNFKQYISNYQRVKELELWEIGLHQSSDEIYLFK